MKLYYSPGACSLAVHIALREAALAFDLVEVDLAKCTYSRAESFRAVNPRGYVPVLELDDGSRHTEVTALLQHVAELAHSGSLLPRTGSAERLQVLQWLTFASTELHGPFGWLWRRDTAESTRLACEKKLKARLAELDRLLGMRRYVAGNEFSIADAYCFTAANWAPHVGISLGDFPSLGAYLARIGDRPAVRVALAAEGLLRAA